MRFAFLLAVLAAGCRPMIPPEIPDPEIRTYLVSMIDVPAVNRSAGVAVGFNSMAW